MGKFALILVFLLLSIKVNAQNQINKKLPLLYAKDKNFTAILDTAISFEEARNHSVDSFMFEIIIRYSRNGVYIIIIYINNIDAIFDIPYGYFNYKNHLFFVSGNYVKKMFKKSNKSRIFQLYDYSNKLRYIYDETEWKYKYCNGKYILVDFFGIKIPNKELEIIEDEY